MGVLEREEREDQRERVLEEERGMEQFTNENADYVKLWFYCIDRVRTQARWHDLHLHFVISSRHPFLKRCQFFQLNNSVQDSS